MQKSRFPQSSWTDTCAEAVPDTPPLAGDIEVDVAIVGAGFTGLTAALHLAEKGVSVAVIEAEQPGFGGSGRNGGQVIPGLKEDPARIIAAFGAQRGEAIVDYAGRYADVVFDLAAKHGIDCDAQRVGWYQGVHSRAALPTVERRARSWAERGANIGIVSGEEFQRKTGARSYVAALFDGRAGSVQPLAFCRGLARAALAAGARVHAGSPAIALAREGGRWRVAAPGGTVSAERVLLATGAYTGGLWPGLEQSVIPVWSYQIATSPLGGNLRGSIMPGGLTMSDTRRVLSYCRQDAKGRLLVGGRGRFKESTDPADFVYVIRNLKRLFPEAAELKLDFCWGGRVALTLDHYPHFGEPAPGLTVALGYYGRGVALGTAAGKVLADHLAGAPLESLPLPVRPISPIPFHGLRGPFLAAAIHTMRLRDAWEARG